jgi:hypothetical protein
MTRGRPSGRPDNPYKKRTRTESKQKKKERMEKMAQTRRDNSAKKKATEAAKKASDDLQVQSDKEKAKSRFFLPRESSNNSRQETVQANPTVQLQHKQDDVVQTANSNTVADTVDRELIVDSVEVSVDPALDIVANLHIDEDDLDDCTTDAIGEEEDYNSTDGGVQQDYIKAVQIRLRDEVSKNNQITDLWLLNHLKKNGWWIRKEHAGWISKRLKDP